MDWYVWHDGEQEGPFSDEQILSLAEMGELKDHFVIRMAGASDWTSVTDVLGLLKSSGGSQRSAHAVSEFRPDQEGAVTKFDRRTSNQSGVAIEQSRGHLAFAKQILFSSKGRMRRLTFLKWWIIIELAGAVIYAVLYNLLHHTLRLDSAQLIAQFVTLLFMLPPHLNIYAKRMHDRDRSTLFAALIFVPIINLWALFEAFFLKGTDGQNRFGDPV